MTVYYLKRSNEIFILYKNSDKALIAEFERKTEQADQVIVNMLLKHGFIERLGAL